MDLLLRHSVFCKISVVNMSEQFSVENKIGDDNNNKSRSAKSERQKIIKQYFNTSLFIICSIGLVKQTVDLFGQYLSAQTVVSVKYESNKMDFIPGITVCYTQALSVERVVQRDFYNDDEIKDDYDFYLNITDAKAFQKIKEQVSKEGAGKVVNELLSDEESSVELAYYTFRRMSSDSKFIPTKEVFNLTIPYEINTRNTFSEINWRTFSDIDLFFKDHVYPVEVTVSGLNENEVKISKFKDIKPIDSIIFEGSDKWKKCFTFFSHLNETWRQKKIIIKDIELDVWIDNKWYPITVFKKDGFEFSMHDPTELPTEFTRLKPFRKIKLDYRIWKTDQTQAKNLVNCRDYDLNDPKNGNRMRFDCVKQCLNNKLLQCSGCSDNSNQTCIFYSNNQWLENQIKEPEIKVMEISNKNQCVDLEFHLESECQNQCQHKCITRFYDYQQKSKVEAAKGLERTGVFIRHSQLPDQVTDVMPEMTFVGFASNFGGLLGLWLGLSAYAVSQYVMNLL